MASNYNELTPFRFWCNKVLPLVYDDSLSYYELLCKVVDYLNKTMEDVNTIAKEFDEIKDLYGTLEEYVNEYFDNLDVQSEIDHKLDEMVSDGTMASIIEPLLESYEAELQEELDNFQEDINGQLSDFQDNINGELDTFQGTVNGTLTGFHNEMVRELDTFEYGVNNRINSVEGSVNNNTMIQNNKIATLESRMDEMTSLPEGSTSGDAELADIRVAANGYVYANAGTAVREQVRNIERTTGGRTLAANLYHIGINLAGLVFETNPNEQNSFILQLNTGDKLKVYTAGWSCQIGFFKTSPLSNVGNTIQYSSVYTAMTTLKSVRTYEYTIPSDAHYVYITNLLNSANHGPNKVTVNGEDISLTIDKRLDTLENDEYIDEFVDQHIEIEQGTLVKIDLTTISAAYYSNCTFPVRYGDVLKITGVNSIANFPLFIMLNNGSAVAWVTDLEEQTAYSDFEVCIPSGVDSIIVNASTSVTNTPISIKKLVRHTASESVNYWKGKKIVWFGTSIPAGGGALSYPKQLEKLLGCTVYNESVGSSEVRGGTHGEYVTVDDPNGYGGVSALGLFLSLSLSVAEKQAIYTNWGAKWSSIITWYQDALDFSKITDYYNSSWDVKLVKYLTGGSVGKVDLYVFDHGYNDMARDEGFTELSDDTPNNNPTDRTYWLGAMNFLFKKILDDNPRAKILIIGHYNNDKNKGTINDTKYVCEAQKKLSESWGYPIAETWNHIGFSASHTALYNGVETPISQIWMPDNIHPASDTTGKALDHYAEVLYPIIRDLR